MAPLTCSGCTLQRTVGHTPVSRTAGTKLARDGLMGRVFEVCTTAFAVPPLVCPVPLVIVAPIPI